MKRRFWLFCKLWGSTRDHTWSDGPLIMERDSANAISWTLDGVGSPWKIHVYLNEIITGFVYFR